jgi:hypothetical protein
MVCGNPHFCADTPTLSSDIPGTRKMGRHVESAKRLPRLLAILLTAVALAASCGFQVLQLGILLDHTMAGHPARAVHRRHLLHQSGAQHMKSGMVVRWFRV